MLTFLCDVLDVPDPANFTYRQKLHWLVPNIPVTAATRLFPSSSASLPASSPLHHATLPAEVVPYLPPHPHKGTRAHRYALVLLAHDRPVKVSESEIDRDSFVLRDFMKSEAFEAPKWGAVTGKKVEVAGLTFFRAAWDEEVCGHIWKDIIGASPARGLFVCRSFVADLDALQQASPRSSTRPQWAQPSGRTLRR